MFVHSEEPLHNLLFKKRMRTFFDYIVRQKNEKSDTRPCFVAVKIPF